MKSSWGGEKRFTEYVDGLPIGETIRALKSIRFGEVCIVLQDSNVVQIDRTEKTRLTQVDMDAL